MKKFMWCCLVIILAIPIVSKWLEGPFAKNLAVENKKLDHRPVFAPTETSTKLEERFKPPPLIEEAYTAPPDREFKIRNETVSFSQTEIDYLFLPTGKIVASDGFYASLAPPPVNKQVKPGSYPIVLAIANYRKDSKIVDHRVAFAMLVFSTAPITHWEAAEQEGFDPLNLLKKGFRGYGVDSGLGCFTDQESSIEMHAASQFESERDTQRLLDDLEADRKKGQKWTEFTKSKGHNSICFESGFGDGCYGSHWGMDANGNVCALVTDFQITE